MLLTNNIYLAGMLGLKTKADRKYFWIEICFLFFITYGIAVLSDLEYSYYEEHNIWHFAQGLEYRLYTEAFTLAFYAAYYWGFLKKAVFCRKLIPIILSVFCFVILIQLYDRYVMYGAISKMSFVSDGLRTRALKELHRPRLYFTFNYFIIAVLLPIIGFAFIMRSMQQDEQMKAMKEQQLFSELNYLKAQIHPHFFFNTINNIYSLALKQSADTAPMVAKLGEMMRYILYEADQKRVLLSKEIGFLNSYVSVEKIRHQQNQNIQFDVQGITGGVYIEPLLLLPFIENAFKHGLEDAIAGGFVNIIICMAEKELTLEVSNSKPIKTEPLITKGIGLQNAIKRLNILYPENYQLDIKDDADVYNVSLTLHTA
jgi:sensor histidine kinase YesM